MCSYVLFCYMLEEERIGTSLEAVAHPSPRATVESGLEVIVAELGLLHDVHVPHVNEMLVVVEFCLWLARYNKIRGQQTQARMYLGRQSAYYVARYD